MSILPVSQKSAWPQTAAYFIALACFGAMVASWGPVLPFIAAQTQTEIGSIGVVFSARAVGVFFGSLLGGRIYDRVPGHPLLGGALLLLAATFSLGSCNSEIMAAFAVDRHHGPGGGHHHLGQQHFVDVGASLRTLARGSMR